MTDTQKNDPVSLSAVFAVAWSVMAEKGVSFLLMGIVGLVPVALIVALFAPNWGVVLDGETSGYWVYGFILPSLATTVLELFMVYGAVRLLEGDNLSPASMAVGGVRYLVPALIATIVATVLIILGMFLLILPGLVLAAFFFVFLPIIIVEDLGVFEALKRCFALVKGNFGPVFLVTLLIYIPAFGFDYVLPPMSDFARVMATYAFDIVMMVLSSVLSVALYQALVRAQGGLTDKDVADVFE